jgi:phosphoglycerate kinase
MVETEMVDTVTKILGGAGGSKIVVPTDVVAAERFAEDAEDRLVSVDEIPPSWMGLDIGPETSRRFGEIIENAKTVFWNGPMGVFEWEVFRSGTEAVANSIAACDGFTAVGGGDSAAALRLLDMEDRVSHLSTGGGAGLELLEGRELPGVAVLSRWAE